MAETFAASDRPAVTDETTWFFMRPSEEERSQNRPGLGKLERAKGFEPSTPTLARSCSTPELHPHPRKPVASQWARHLCQTMCRIANPSSGAKRTAGTCPDRPFQPRGGRPEQTLLARSCR